MASKHSGNEVGLEAGACCRLVSYRTLAPFFGPGLLLGFHCSLERVVRLSSIRSAHFLCCTSLLRKST